MCSAKKRGTNEEFSSNTEIRAPPRLPLARDRLLSNGPTRSLWTPPTLNLFSSPRPGSAARDWLRPLSWSHPLLAGFRLGAACVAPPSAPRATGRKHGGSRGSRYRPRFGGFLAGPAARVLRGRSEGFGDCGMQEVPRTGGRRVVSDKIPLDLGAGP